MLDDYIEYLRSINSEIYRNGVRLPLNLDSDYVQVSRSVGILDDFLYYNRILSLCGSTHKIKSLSSGSEVLYSEVMKSEFFAEFMERRQKLRDSEEVIPVDPMAQHSEVQMLSSVLRNFENSEYSNSEEKLKSVGVDDFMSRFVIEPVEFEGDDVNNYEDYEEEEYPVDAQGNRVSEEEYTDSDDLEFDNYDDLDDESVSDDIDNPYENDLDFDNYDDLDDESVSDDIDNPYENDLDFDNYDDLDNPYGDESNSDSYDMSDDMDSPYDNESEEGYAEPDDTDDYGVSYEGIDEDDELLLDSLSSLSDSAEDIDADFGFDSSDDALGFDTEISDYEDDYSIDDNYDFEEDEEIDDNYDFEEDEEIDDNYDFEEDEEIDDNYEFDDEDDGSYEEDAYDFDDPDEDMYSDLDNEAEGEDDLPDEDSNYFDSILDDDEEYYGYDDFERDTSRVYDESEIFNSGSSVNLKTQISNSERGTSTAFTQSKDSDEILADVLTDGLTKVLNFGKSKLKSSGLLDKDTK